MLIDLRQLLGSTIGRPILYLHTWNNEALLFL